MKLKIYQVDAFANAIFTGNPAAVVPLEEWLSDVVMQKIAAENNLAETAFFVKNETGFYIRWFTATNEVPLCGHATLASAYVLFEILQFKENKILFDCKSGRLEVSKNQDWLTLNFPANPIQATNLNFDYNKALGKVPSECFSESNYTVLLYDSENDIIH